MNAPPETSINDRDVGAARKPGLRSAEVRSESRAGGAASSMPNKHRVLLVDDEEGVVAALRRLLRREDYELLTANTGAEALQIIADHPASLVISDYRMPGMNGVQLLHEIRELSPNTLRIILSGYSEVDAIINAVNEGEIYKFITKPWNDEELKLHVRRALEQYELKAENGRLSQEVTTQNERLRELNTILEQRAADASTGLTSTQDMLENLGVGVLVIDPTGLVVGANRRANELISSGESELIGMPTVLALPKELHDVACLAERSNGIASGCMVLEEKKLQCRITPLIAGGESRGCVMALWEEVG